jgi:hypothetical protein
MPKIDANIAAGDGKDAKAAGPDVNVDSVTAAAKAGAADAVKEEAKSAAKNAAAKKLKGIFKR